MAPSAAPFELEIRSFGNKSLIHTLTCKWHTSIKDIKDDLHYILKIPPSRLHLFYVSSSKPLRNSAHLADLGIDQSGYCLHLKLVNGVAFDVPSVALVPMRESYDDAACKQMLTQVSMGLQLHKPTSTDILDCTGGVYFMKDPKGAKVAVFKPCDEEQGMPNNGKGHAGNGERGLRPHFIPGCGHMRETASYLFDYKNFAQVPATTIAHCESPVFNYPQGKGGYRQSCPKIGSLQLFVRSCTDTYEDISPSLISTFELQKIALLDMRLMNSDRNESNILLIPKPYHLQQQQGINARRNSRTNSVGSYNSEQDGDIDCEVDFVDEMGHESYAAAVTSNENSRSGSITHQQQYQQSKDQYELIPIDHGYCFPTKLRINEWDWTWFHTSHMSKEVDPEIKKYINSINIEELLATVTDQVYLHPDSVFLLRVAHKVIVDGIAAGLTLRQIAELFCRMEEDAPSPLERLIEISEDNAFQTIESRIDANFFQKDNLSNKQQQRVSLGGSAKKKMGVEKRTGVRVDVSPPPPQSQSGSTDRMVATADARKRLAANFSATMSMGGLASPGKRDVNGLAMTFSNENAAAAVGAHSHTNSKPNSPSLKLRRIVESEADLETMATRNSLHNSPRVPITMDNNQTNQPGQPLQRRSLQQMPSPLRLALMPVVSSDEHLSTMGSYHNPSSLSPHQQLSPSASVGYFVQDLSETPPKPSTPIPAAADKGSGKDASANDTEAHTSSLSLFNPRNSFAGKPLLYMQSLDPTSLNDNGKHSSNINKALLAHPSDGYSSDNLRLFSGELSVVSTLTAETPIELLRSTSYLDTFLRQVSISVDGSASSATTHSANADDEHIGSSCVVGKSEPLTGGIPPVSLVWDTTVSNSYSHDDDKDITTAEEMTGSSNHDCESPIAAVVAEEEAAERGLLLRSNKFVFSNPEHSIIQPGGISRKSTRVASFSPEPQLHKESSSVIHAAETAPALGAAILLSDGDQNSASKVSGSTDDTASNIRSVDHSLYRPGAYVSRELRTATYGSESFSPYSLSSTSSASSPMPSSLTTPKKTSFTPSGDGGMFIAGNDPTIKDRASSILSRSSTSSENTDNGVDSEGERGSDPHHRHHHNQKSRSAKTATTRDRFSIGGTLMMSHASNTKSHEKEQALYAATATKVPTDVFNQTLSSPMHMPPPVAISRAISFNAFSNAIPKSSDTFDLDNKPGRQLSRLRREKRRHTATSEEFQQLRGNFALDAVHSLITKVSNKRSPIVAPRSRLNNF